ncbi:MAG TPA: N-acetylmannosamine-6-phosphate 2-epimerase [Candidatus Obscuribacterales bacterium]
MTEHKQTTAWQRIKEIEGGLIVSCQASAGEPLCAPEHILALSLSAINGGAKGLRLEGIENIRLVREHTKVPIIGLTKSEDVPAAERLRRVYITATYAEASSLAAAGADIVALDSTRRPRPDGSNLKDLIGRIHDQLNIPVWADIATFGEGMAAVEAGADIVSTTLYGYTEETAAPDDEGPNMELLKELIAHLSVPVILEGRVWHPAEVTQAFALGAHAVVVGSAITRPQLITARFVKAIASRPKRR